MTEDNDIHSDIISSVVAAILSEKPGDDLVLDFEKEERQPVPTSVRLSNRSKYHMEVIRGWLIDQGYLVSQNQFISAALRVFMEYIAKVYRNQSVQLKALFLEMRLHKESERARSQYRDILTYMDETKKSVEEALRNGDVALAGSLLGSWQALAETEWGDWRDGIYSRGLEATGVQTMMAVARINKGRTD